MKREDFDYDNFKLYLEVIYYGNGELKHIQSVYGNFKYIHRKFTKQDLEYFFYEELLKHTKNRYSVMYQYFLEDGTGFVLVSDRLKVGKNILHIDGSCNVSIKEIKEFLNSVYENVYIMKEL